MESESSHVSVQGVDGEGESEREGKKGGADRRAGESDDSYVPCQLCFESMGSDDPKGRPWKGSYHVPCIERERRRVINEISAGSGYAGRRRRRGGS